MQRVLGMVTYHASRYRIAGNFQGRKLAKFEVLWKFSHENYFLPTCESFPLYSKWYPGVLKKQYFAIAPSSQSLDWSYNKTNQLEYMTPEITLPSLTLTQLVLAPCTCNSTFLCRVHVCIWIGPINFDAVHLAPLCECHTFNRITHTLTDIFSHYKWPQRHKMAGKDMEGAWLSLLKFSTYWRYPAIVTGS